MEEQKKLKKLKKPSKSAINTKPQLTDVIEQDSPAVAKDPIIEKVLDLVQRRKRALTMRRLKPKLERGRALTKKRMPTDVQLKRRAQKTARSIFRRRMAGQRGVEYATLSPSDKIAVDKVIDKKVAAIKKLASRLVPRMRQAAAAKLSHIKAPQSAHLIPLQQSFEFERLVDAFLTEDRAEKVNKLLKLGLADQDKINQYKQALANPEQAGKYSVLRKHLIKMLDRLFDLVTDDPTVFQKTKATLQRDRDYDKQDKKVEEALKHKADKSGVPLDVISEVFARGLRAGDSQQHAFNRVNSFIAGGKARDLDNDLWEQEVWDKPNPKKSKSKMTPKQVSKAKARARAAGRPYPNLVDNMAAMKEQTNKYVDTKPKLSKKTIEKEIYSVNRKSADPMSEERMLVKKIKTQLKKPQISAADVQQPGVGADSPIMPSPRV